MVPMMSLSYQALQAEFLQGALVASVLILNCFKMKPGIENVLFVCDPHINKTHILFKGMFSFI